MSGVVHGLAHRATTGPGAHTAFHYGHADAPLGNAMTTAEVALPPVHSALAAADFTATYNRRHVLARRKIIEEPFGIVAPPDTSCGGHSRMTFLSAGRLPGVSRTQTAN